MSWNLAGMAEAGKAATVLAAGEAMDLHILLLQDVGAAAVWEAATDPEGGGRCGWDVRVHEARRGGVAVAVRTDVAPFLSIETTASSPYVQQVVLEWGEGGTLADTTVLHAVSVYWPPSQGLSSAAAGDMKIALGPVAEGVTRVVGGDVNAALGDWLATARAPAPYVPPAAGGLGEAWGYPHAEKGVVASPATLDTYKRRAQHLQTAANEGGMLVLDGLMEPAEPTRRTATTATPLTHFWGSQCLVDALGYCRVIEPSHHSGHILRAAVRTDHLPVVLVLDMEEYGQPVGATGAAGAAAGGRPAVLQSPRPLPVPRGEVAAADYVVLSGKYLQEDLSAVYSVHLRRGLEFTPERSRQHAVTAIVDAICTALGRAALEVCPTGGVKRGRGGGSGRPQTRPLLVPVDVVKAASPALQAAAAAVRGGEDAGGALLDIAAQLHSAALKREVSAAATAAAAQRGTAVPALRRVSARLKMATLRALASQLGENVPADTLDTLPRRLLREGHPDVRCGADASMDTCAAMMEALQSCLLPGGGEQGENGEVPAPHWERPPLQAMPGEPPVLDFDALKAASAMPELAPPAARLDAPFTPGEVAAAVKAMKTGVAHGTEGLKAEHLKGAHPCVHTVLAFLLNAVMYSRTLPESWAWGRLLALPKRAGAKAPGDFRPLTLYATLRKVLATALLRRLALRCEAAGVPGDGQHAYRAHRNTDTALLALRAAMYAISRAGGRVVVICLDISKAFDTLPRDAIRAALLAMGCTLEEVEVVGILYQDTAAALEAATPHGTLRLAEPRAVRTGVAQGCPLSGLLFVATLHAVEAAVREAWAQEAWGGAGADYVAYADDIFGVVDGDAAAARFVHLVREVTEGLGLRIALHKCTVLRAGVRPTVGDDGQLVVPAPLDLTAWRGAAGATGESRGAEDVDGPAQEGLGEGEGGDEGEGNGEGAGKGEVEGAGEGPGGAATEDAGGSIPGRHTAVVLGYHLDWQDSGTEHAIARAKLCVALAQRLVADGLHVRATGLDLARDLWTMYLEPVLLAGCEQVPTANVCNILMAGQLRAVTVLMRLWGGRMSAGAMVRELAVRPAAGEVLARALGLAGRVTEWLHGSHARGGLRELEGALGESLLPHLGTNLQTLAAATSGGMAAVQRTARRDMVRKLTTLSGRSHHATWMSMSAYTLGVSPLDASPWWVGGGARATHAVLILRLRAWPAARGACDCGAADCTREHVVFDCELYRDARTSLAGFLSFVARSRLTRSAALHALLGTNVCVLMCEMQASVATMRQWLHRHAPGTGPWLLGLVKVWKHMGALVGV